MKNDKDLIKPTVAWFTAPVVLVSCSNNKTKNIITIAWTGVVCSKPPLLSISVRPERFSHSLIYKSKEFVINIPTINQLQETKLCGKETGRDIDKWSVCNFTALKASKVNVPLIKECPINIECGMIRDLSLGTHTMFIGEVLAIHVDKQLNSSFDVLPLCYSVKSGVFGKSVSLD